MSSAVEKIRAFRAGPGKGLKLGVESEIGEALYDFVRKRRIRRVVETGVMYGFSSWYFLEALKETDGRLWSIESVVQQHVVPEELKSRWTFVKGVSPKALWDLIQFETQFDLFWHDSDHTFGVQFGEYVMASKGCTYIGSHDVRRTGAWLAFLDLYGWKEILCGRKWGIAEKIL